jgi:protein TonB
LPPNPAPASAPPPPAPTTPELIGFDQTPSSSAKPSATSDESARVPVPETKSNERPPWEQKPEPKQEQKHEIKREEELAHSADETEDSEDAPRPRSPLKRAIIGALLLAACAILSAPQAPWHPQVRALWAHGQQTLHGWLNPQPVTPVQAPVAHEDFGRAGDEYKLPVTENIPDATTDPSQIHVLPVVDPTIKKPNSLGGNAEPAQGDPTSTAPTDQPPSASPDTAQPITSSPSGTTAPPPASTPVAPLAIPLHPDPAPTASPSSTVSYSPVQPAPRNSQTHTAPAGNVPSSLKSQMATTTPDAGGDKAPESAMPSIEPVVVSEAAERALLTEQPPLDYPASGRGQQGTVVLQVLIGRDGTVKDAKFMQGSFAFARAAIDGVKLWKFKPYFMNGRPVSIQSLFTINFKP